MSRHIYRLQRYDRLRRNIDQQEIGRRRDGLPSSKFTFRVCQTGLEDEFPLKIDDFWEDSWVKRLIYCTFYHAHHILDILLISWEKQHFCKGVDCAAPSGHGWGGQACLRIGMNRVYPQNGIFIGKLYILYRYLEFKTMGCNGVAYFQTFSDKAAYEIIVL